MSRRTLRRFAVSLAGLILLNAAALPVAADQPGWNWTTASPSSRDAAKPADASSAERLSDAVAGAGAAEDLRDDESETGVAGAISSIMRPNEGRVLSNEAEVEALRRRAQTGQPGPR